MELDENTDEFCYIQASVEHQFVAGDAALVFKFASNATKRHMTHIWTRVVPDGQTAFFKIWYEFKGRKLQVILARMMR